MRLTTPKALVHNLTTNQPSHGRGGTLQTPRLRLERILGESVRRLNTVALSAIRSRTVVPFIAIAAGALAVSLARSTHPSERFSFWGEDGNVFTTEVRSHGVLHSLTTTYAGYFELLPRLLAASVSGLPLQWTPPLYATLAMTVSAVVAAISFLAARDGLKLPVWASLTVSATLLLLPSSGPETFASLTNLEWYCEAGAIVFLAAWWHGWKTSPVLTGLFVFVAFATSPISFVVLPIILLRTLVRRNRLDLVILSSTLVASLYQGIAHLVARPVPTSGGVHVGKIISIYAVRVVDDALAGFDLSYTAWRALTPGGSVVVGLALLGFLVASIAMCRSSRARGTALVLVALSVALYVLAALERDLSSLGNVGFAPANGSAIPLAGRYMGTPSVCLELAVLILLAPRKAELRDVSKEPLRRVSLALLCGVFGAFLVYNVPLDLGRFPLANWEKQVRTAQAYCRSHQGEGRISIVNAPGRPWSVNITCRQAFG